MVSKILLQPLVIVLAVSILFNAAAWLVAMIVFPEPSPAAILHYTVPLGVDFIGESRQIYVLPAVGLVVLVGNTILGWLIRRPSVRAAWVLWAALPGIQLILLAAVVMLWQFNR